MGTAPDRRATAAQLAPATRIDHFLHGLAHQGLFTGSVYVERDGHVLLRRGYGWADWDNYVHNTAQTPMLIGPLTMEFTAMGILQLQRDGRLRLSDPICAYLSGCPASWNAITIHQLLSHTSGIPTFTDFPTKGKTGATPTTPSATIALIKDRPLNFSPGAKFDYSMSNYILLGSIIERVSGESYQRFLQDHIFRPLGMSRSLYDPENENSPPRAQGYRFGLDADPLDLSIPYAAAGLTASVTDLGRWDDALDAARLIPPSLQRKMFTPYRGHYGYGWFVGKPLGHPGLLDFGSINGFVALNSRFTDPHVTVIVLCNDEALPVDLIWYQVAEIALHG